jgi:hypothetical protein
MSNFVYFEDPRTLTEARLIYFHHNTPDAVGTLAAPGGAVDLYAAQLRFALSERLSVIAVKDGYITTDFGSDPLATALRDGWADVTAGLKYNWIRDPEAGTLLSGGITYEIPLGSNRAQQGLADGEFHFFLTGGQRFWDGMGHYLGAFGVRTAVDSSAQVSSWHWSNHVDVKLLDTVYLFTEVVWQHYTDSANVGLPLGVGGMDVFDLPATNVEGLDLVTQAVGLKYKPSGNTELGVMYEFPVTGFQDIIKDRLQLEWILRY